MSDSNVVTPPVKPFTGRHMALIMGAFFGTIIAVNVLMAVIAGRSWTGLVVKNSYVASQEFNDHLDKARDQAERGWRSHFGFANGAVSFRLEDRTGKRIPFAEVLMKFGHPAHEQADQTIALIADGAAYSAPLALETGIWAITITARAQGEDYRRDVRLFVSKDGTGKLQ